ncbi:hypothetical protein MACK_002812 [Theileria orientalis]|uniref:Clp1 P-loop domain-containing protein n=1 Tax=Theileria orientalis TaxID=68886 RepID=A0A976ME53_THEOR|nr:hypothetical protein MACK_002812 [Theileria orientalis]
MCTLNKHFNYQLNPNQVRRRLLSYRGQSNLTSPDDSVPSPSESECLLLGLVAGEYLLFNKSINLKVIHGCAEIGGHVYPVMDSYRKFSVTPWSPSERLLSLCYKTKYKGKRLVNVAENVEYCKDCMAILNKLYGGTCCNFVSKHKAHRKMVMKHFGVGESELQLESDKYKEYVKYYESQMNQEFDTVIMLYYYTSCFGTVSVYDALDTLNPPRLMPYEILRICEKLLNLFISGSNPVLMLHGDKGSGKSTVVTYVINYLLNFVSNVCILDVDVGQPLISAPGLITLTFISQSITSSIHSMVRDIKPKISLLFGDVKPGNSLLVLRHVKTCLDMYEKHQRSFKAPLIINTFGWTSGMGGKVIEAIGSIAKVEIMLKLVNFPRINQMINVSTHEELKYHLDQLHLRDLQVKQPYEEYEIDTFPLFSNVVEELGGKIPWDKSNKEYHLPSFQNYLNLLKSCNIDQMCTFDHFYHLLFKRESVAPSDMRWLRFCSYLNNSFADALHFPQLRHEEFFGNVETYNFMRNVKHADKFESPRQYQLNAAEYTFVVQSDILPNTHAELVPMISGSIIGLCRGKVKEPFKSRISDQWHFVSYAYVHYLNPEDLSMLISYPRYKTENQISNTNIVVMCLMYGFEPCPGKMFGLNSYPSTNTPKLDHLASQVYPFRRNDLLHMVGSYGAGASAPTQRANLKRFKNESGN